MTARVYSGVTAKVNDRGEYVGQKLIRFSLEDVCGLTCGGDGIRPLDHFACLVKFSQVKIDKQTYNQLVRAGKEVASLV